MSERDRDYIVRDPHDPPIEIQATKTSLQHELIARASRDSGVATERLERLRPSG